MSLRKVEQELDKTEKKYHEATKEVELTRQACDAEMCRVRNMFITFRKTHTKMLEL